MTLRTKTLLIITATLVGLIALLYASSKHILMGSFADLERESVQRNVRRASQALTNEIAILTSTAIDWAYWDDTYQFVEDADPAYVRSNVTASTFITGRLNALVLINRDGEIVLSEGFNLYREESAPLPDGLEAHLGPGSLLVPESDRLDMVSGVLSLPGGPLLVSSLPILTSSAEGPSHGRLIFGRSLDSVAVQHLAEMSDLLLSTTSLDGPLTRELEQARAELDSPASIHIRPLSVQSIAGYGLFADIYGSPALLLKVEMSRDIYEQGRASIWYFMLALVGSGIVFSVMVLLLLEQSVLAPLARLSQSVSQVGKSSDLSRRVPVSGRDELSQLANAVNRMLGAVEQSQASVRESEERLRTVIANAPVIFYALDRQGRFTLLDGRGLRDLQPEALIGKPVSDLFGSSPAISEQLQRGLVGDVFVESVQMDDRTFEVYYHPLVDGDHMITGMIGVATDITERQRAEAAEHEQRMMAEALRDTAAALASTLDLAEVLKRILTNVGRVVPSDATNIMLLENGIASVVDSRGYAERGLDGWIGRLQLHVADDPGLQQIVSQGRLLIIPNTQDDGGWMLAPEMQWVRSSASAPICLDGQVIGVLNLYSATPNCFSSEQAGRLQTFADQAALAIHNAQLYEAERHERLLAQTLRKTAEALAASGSLEYTLNLIVDKLGQVVRYDRAVIMLDEGDYLRVVGARGFDEQDEIFTTSYFYPSIPLFNEPMTEGKPVVLADARQDQRWGSLPCFKPTTRGWIGAPLVVREVVIGFLSVASNQPDAYDRRDVEAVSAFGQQAALAVVNARIMSELETRLAELREAETHLVRTARLSAAGEIATGVAHQINNPLTTVIAEAYLLLQDLDPSDPNYESAEAIREAANRAGAVVRRLLDLTRSLPYDLQTLDINALLDNSIALMRAQIAPHIARLEVDLAPDLPPIDASPQHLEDVLINLLLNARDAVNTREGGMIKVTSGLSATGDAIRITVQDNGPGIPPEDLQRIFEPFFTTKDYGTGLGLSICHDVVTRHGGQLQVDSMAGQGTSFTIILPLGKQSQPAMI